MREKVLAGSCTFCASSWNCDFIGNEFCGYEFVSSFICWGCCCFGCCFCCCCGCCCCFGCCCCCCCGCGSSFSSSSSSTSSSNSVCVKFILFSILFCNSFNSFPWRFLSFGISLRNCLSISWHFIINFLYLSTDIFPDSIQDVINSSCWFNNDFFVSQYSKSSLSFFFKAIILSHIFFSSSIADILFIFFGLWYFSSVSSK